MNKTTLLEKLYQELLDLKSSPLYTYRTENHYFPVLGEGSADSHIVFIGEAPGKNEAITGKPFCGAAGKILDQLCEHAGISRSNIYITNIVHDKPPENRDPTVHEIELYAPFLDKLIDIIQPKVFVTLGRYSMEYIMKKYGLVEQLEPISKAHGKTYTTNQGFDIVILYHPSVAIYSRKSLPILKKDIEVLKKYY
ncbi:MAG: uracil-DNA glycosylase [bacterium]|nr:uracil-DNA glycosylase [bacterium]